MTTPEPQRSDPFLDEVRALKRAAFARSGDDLKRHFERLRQIEQQHKGRIVPPPTGKSDSSAA